MAVEILQVVLLIYFICLPHTSIFALISVMEIKCKYIPELKVKKDSLYIAGNTCKWLKYMHMKKINIHFSHSGVGPKKKIVCQALFFSDSSPACHGQY